MSDHSTSSMSASTQTAPSELAATVPPSKIGRTLLRRRAGILSLCERLQSAVTADQGQPVAGIAQRMTGKLASVSFIGQVKAGKTSLMNAFIGRPGFLPADVNPWTAVITRVTFGKDGTNPGAAVFSFFDDAEWQSFTQREGRLQEVIKTIPGSEDKIATVEAEVERMRARARFRLGDSFEALLGQAHAFRAVTPEILARYICAGDDPEGRLRSPTAGRFADITREAVINFGLDRFEHPLVTVDTPGLNDPLLIREEVTLRSLEGSDIFVLVLTAHQAFSSTDLYLLRILNAMRLDRLIIFVNRVDELTNPVNDLPEITRHVKDMLRREKLPEDVPVIYGSAMWAEYALGIEELVDLEQIDTFCKIFVTQEDVAEARQLFEMPDHARAWAASGLASLDRAVDHMLNSGPGRIATAKACVDLRNALQLIVMANDAELEQNRHRYAQLSGDEGGSGDIETTGPLDTESLRLTVSEMSEKLQKEMMDSLTAAWARTRFGLRRIIKDFAEDQDKQFAAYLGQTKKKEWVCDTTPLRRDLSAFFRDEYPAVKESLRRRLERGVGRIVQTLD